VPSARGHGAIRRPSALACRGAGVAPDGLWPLLGRGRGLCVVCAGRPWLIGKFPYFWVMGSTWYVTRWGTGCAHLAADPVAVFQGCLAVVLHELSSVPRPPSWAGRVNGCAGRLENPWQILGDRCAATCFTTNQFLSRWWHFDHQPGAAVGPVISFCRPLSRIVNRSVPQAVRVRAFARRPAPGRLPFTDRSRRTRRSRPGGRRYPCAR
jgi:hypothetical protein